LWKDIIISKYESWRSLKVVRRGAQINLSGGETLRVYIKVGN